MTGMVLGVLALFSGACRDEPATLVAGESVQDLDADYVVYGSETVLTVDGVRSGNVRADSAYVYNDQAENHLFGVFMTLFDDMGAVRARLTSNTGVLEQRTDRMVARGNVILIVEEQNLRIESPELHYDPTSERIRSDSATTVVQNGRTTRGTAFRSDLELRNWSLENPRGAIANAPGGGG